MAHVIASAPALAARELLIGRGRPLLTHGLELVLAPGRCLAIVGPNGCGKSTLLQILAGLEPALGGTLHYSGVPAATDSRERARQCAYMTQQPVLPAGFTVREVISFGRAMHTGWQGNMATADTAAIDAAIALLALGELSFRSVDSLSGGERQRVVIARTLSSGAPLLLFDEPFNHLDVRHTPLVTAALKQTQQRRGAALVVVSHDLNWVRAHADQVLLIDSDGTASSGPPETQMTPRRLSELFKTPIEESVALLTAMR
jgi:ABC-type cobalamin/Fe3+-siderophores transport system ATPase subunit